MPQSPTIILGIDPGFAITGYGVIAVSGSRFSVIDHGCVFTKPKDSFSTRLHILHNELTEIIEQHRPSIMAVEELFFNKNVTTAMKVSQARGVILLTGIQADLRLLEYTPLQVKQAVCGYGRADKKQVQQMVKTILKLDAIPQPDDAADALAVAVCAASSHKLQALYEKIQQK